MEEQIRPKVIGFALLGNQKATEDMKHVCYKEVKNLKEHAEKFKFINRRKISNIHNTYRGNNIHEILRTVTVSGKITTHPLETFFKKSKKNLKVAEIFNRNKPIITTNLKVIKEIIKSGRLSDPSSEPRVYKSETELKGKCIPGEQCNTTTVKMLKEPDEQVDYDGGSYTQGKGRKLEQYLTTKEGEPPKSYDLYAILCLETDDAIYLYCAEIDAVRVQKANWDKAELLEIKLFPDFTEENGNVIKVEDYLTEMFEKRNPEAEVVREFMPVLDGILRGVDKLNVTYFSKDSATGRNVWKCNKEYDYVERRQNDVLRLGLSKNDVVTLKEFAKSLFS